MTKSIGNNTVDLMAVESGKQKAQVKTCYVAMLFALALSMASLICGVCLPVWVTIITPGIVWWSMTLEFLAYVFYKASQWISKNTL